MATMAEQATADDDARSGETDRRGREDRREIADRRLPDGIIRTEGSHGREEFLDDGLNPRKQWFTAGFELLFFYAAALAFDYLVLQGNRYLEVAPNPFWIPVIVLTVQYGTSFGLLAAIASTLVLYVGNVPPQQLNQDLYAYLFQLFVTPMLWLVSAVLLGAIRDRQVADRATLRRSLARARAQATAIADRYEKLKNAKREIEARLASQLRTVTSLYRGASALERLTVQEVLDGFDDIFSAVMDAEAYSLFLLTSEGLEVARTVGWREGDRWQRFFGHDHVLLQAVIGQLDFAVVNEPNGERLLAGEGLMAGPVVDPQDQSLIGMIKVERVPFSQMDYESVDRFEIICSWVGAALSRARRFEQADADRLTRDGLMLSTAAYQHQKRFLERLAGRGGFAASILVIRPPAEMAQDTDLLRQIRDSIAYAVQKILRTTDEAYEIDDDGFSFAVMLPGASEADAKMLAARLRAAMAEKLDAGHEGTPRSSRIEVGVEALSQKTQAPPPATAQDLGICPPE